MILFCCLIVTLTVRFIMNAYKLACISASISFLLFTNIPLCSGATSGVIHIVGMIVEDGCTINNSQQTVHIECFNDGKETETTAPINSSEINFPTGKVTGIKWLHANHDLGIMNVEYE